MKYTRTRPYALLFVLVFMLVSWQSSGQRILIPCLDEEPCDPGGGTGVLITFTGSTSASINETKTYYLTVNAPYTVTYPSPIGGTIIYQNTTQVQVKWTTSGSRYIQANVVSGGTLYQKYVYVSVTTPLTGGQVTASTNTNICNIADGDPGIINNTLSPTGGTGSYSYQWQEFDESGGGFVDPEGTPVDPMGWVNIPGASLNTYNPPRIYESKMYRRKVTSGSSIAYSNTIYYSFAPPLSAGAITYSGGTINTGAQPAVISGTSASGGSGSYAYQWQQSIGSGFINITGATSSNYQPPALNVTTTYRRQVSSCNTTLSTNQVTVSVNLNPGILLSGVTEICEGGELPQLSATSASGGNGVYTYSLEKRYYHEVILELEGFPETYWEWTNWETIGTGEMALNGGMVNYLTEYRRKVVSGTTTNYTNVVEIDLKTAQGGTITSGISMIGIGAVPGLLTGSGGTDPDVSYSWQKKTTGGFSTISGTTGTGSAFKNYQPVAQTVTTTYRRVSTVCGQTAYSNEVMVRVLLNPGTVEATTSLVECYNSSMDPGPINGLTAPTGGTGIYTYQWQYWDPFILENPDPSEPCDPNDELCIEGQGGNGPVNLEDGWVDYANATTAGFNPGVLTQTTNMRRKVVSTIDMQEDYNYVLFRFVDVDDITSVEHGTRVGAGSVTLSVDNGGNGIYQWYSDPNTPVEGETTSVLTVQANKSKKYFVHKYTDVCPTQYQSEVSVSVVPSISQNGSTTLTAGGIMTLSADEGHDTYSWKDGNGVEKGTGSSLQVSKAGTYTLEVTSNGITTSNSIEVRSMNHIVTRSFAVASETDLTPIEIGKSAQFFDDAGHALQSQSWDRASGQVFATEPLYDRYRRAVGSTLSAPIEQTELGYKEGFITTNNGQAYDWQAFDTDVTHYDPNHLDNATPGTLGHFYSDNYPDPESPSSDSPGTTKYPYSRQDFYEDGSGEAKSSAGPGDEFYMGSGKESYGKSLPVLNGELPLYNTLRDLIVYKNKDASITKTNRLMKSVGRDTNGKEAVSYADESGNTLASLLPGGSKGYPLSVSAEQLIENQKVFEFHVPTSESAVLVGAYAPGGLTIKDKLTGEPVAAGININPSLAPGFYAIEYTGSVLNATLAYSLKYTNHAYNFYDNRGRLVASIAPKGMEMLLDMAPENLPTTVAELPFTTFYEYDFQGRLLKMTEPDAGETNYKYRMDGMIRFSQNAKQKEANRFSYTDYDKLGRPVESGEYFKAGLTFDNLDAIPLGKTAELYVDGTKYDWIQTTYDVPYNLTLYPQEFIIGGVSWTQNAYVKTIYSYDDMGRVTWMVQEFTLPNNLSKTFRTDYEYDFLGNVLKVSYQHGQADAFYHYYEYDANYRLTKVETSKGVSTTKTLQAKYEYYLHGPLKRVVIGDDLQGVDYKYNLQGWLTKINDPNDATDEGTDLLPATNPDVFAMELDYFGDNTDEDFPALYNGQIRSQKYRTGAASAMERIDYAYDEKYQLKESKSYDVQTEQYLEKYRTEYAYDVNGNIRDLVRNDATGTVLDNFTADNTLASTSTDDDGYQYVSGKNQLDLVYKDGTKTNTHADYTYNEIGQMTEMTAYNYDSLLYQTSRFIYDVSGKLIEVKDDADNTMYRYRYDDRGFRIMKDYANPLAIDELYVRDASGSLMAIYTVNGNNTAPIEYPIYGASRLGSYFITGITKYELKDHLGNVRAVITENTSNAQELRLSNYYPYGMRMGFVGVTPPSEKYRFGYQGDFSEEDEETGFNHFEAREYDPKIGRWMVVDPARQFDSGYVGMGNSPILGVDPDGRFLWWGRKNDADRAAFNLNGIFKSKFSIDNAVSVVEREAEQSYSDGIWDKLTGQQSGTRTIKQYRIEANGDWDLSGLSSEDQFIVKSFADVLSSPEDIRGMLVHPDTPGKGIYTVGDLSGKTFSQNLFKIPNNLPDFNTTKSQFNIGSQILHEVLWHISPAGRTLLNAGYNSNWLYQKIGGTNGSAHIMNTGFINPNLPVRKF